MALLPQAFARLIDITVSGSFVVALATAVAIITLGVERISPSEGLPLRIRIRGLQISVLVVGQGPTKPSSVVKRRGAILLPLSLVAVFFFLFFLVVCWR
jgi:hypothetical protein